MVKVFVDGVECEVDEKKNLIDALAGAGVEIPHFCYHPKLPVVGMCRICLIEVEGVPKFQAACNTPVKEGMKINAFGEKVVKAREGVMEFLLINHPLDCPVCDKAGECRLQNYSFSIGGPTTRFEETKRNVPQEKIGTNLLINHNRCILCYRCVRFDRDIVGVNDLEMLARGNDTIIAYTPPETSGVKSEFLNHNYQGALADICPVGALLNENTLFQSRVWWYESSESICHGCSSLCKITTNVKNQEIYRYMPRSAPESDGHFICDYGRFSSRDFTQNRLSNFTHKGTKIKSHDALEKIAEKFNAAKKIVILGGASESCADIDEIMQLKDQLQTAGKSVAWDFRAHDEAYAHKAGESYDFLLSKDLRPNAAYARTKSLTAFTNTSERDAALQAADLIIVLNEFSAPFAYREMENTSHVKDLKIASQIEATALYQLMEQAGFLEKTINFTTHNNKAVAHAFISVPIQTFVEKAGTYIDYKGVQKTSNRIFAPIQGLFSAAEWLRKQSNPITLAGA